MLKQIGRNLFLSMMLIAITSCGTRDKEVTVKTFSPPSRKAQVQSHVVAQDLPSVKTQPQTHKIGLLLPLTGPHAELGKGLLNAAEMALFETNPKSSTITLLPQDTALGAHQAAQKAIDDGAELILGPVFAKEVELIQPLLKSRNVNLISFSTDRSMARKGSFILGLLPSQQIDRIVAFARERGMTKLAVLTPDDDYGRLVDHTLKDLELKGDVQLLGTTHYSKGDLLEGNPGNMRILEDVESYKTKGLQALVIPEGGENLNYLMNILKDAGPFIVLGSGQWDSPQTLKAFHHFKEGYFVSTDPQERDAFEERFRQAFGYIPPRISTLSYDATALAIALADQEYSSEKLTLSQGFTGVEGLFRLTQEGLNERGFAVIGVTPAGFKMISPAPQAF